MTAEFSSGPEVPDATAPPGGDPLGDGPAAPTAVGAADAPPLAVLDAVRVDHRLDVRVLAVAPSRRTVLRAYAEGRPGPADDLREDWDRSACSGPRSWTGRSPSSRWAGGGGSRWPA
jgi:hypothetical protein